MIVTEKQDFVEFISPGTLFAETTSKQCLHGDIKTALTLSESINERHNAKPAGFRFYTVESETVVDDEGNRAEKDSRKINISGVHWINGRLIRFDEVPDDREHSIMRENMRCNNMAMCVETNNSWRYTGEFAENDVVVSNGRIIARGNDSEFMKYREEFSEWRKRYYAELQAKWNRERVAKAVSQELKIAAQKGTNP